MNRTARLRRSESCGTTPSGPESHQTEDGGANDGVREEDEADLSTVAYRELAEDGGGDKSRGSAAAGRAGNLKIVGRGSFIDRTRPRCRSWDVETMTEKFERQVWIGLENASEKACSTRFPGFRKKLFP